ncbi:MAG: hypothetical protein K2N26_03825, partial [Oscillospiraceae bacterium]|nr:hypothetical protein [Oscillospiraceae bacterium]
CIPLYAVLKAYGGFYIIPAELFNGKIFLLADIWKSAYLSAKKFFVECDAILEKNAVNTCFDGHYAVLGRIFYRKFLSKAIDFQRVLW